MSVREALKSPLAYSFARAVKFESPLATRYTVSNDNFQSLLEIERLSLNMINGTKQPTKQAGAFLASKALLPNPVANYCECV